MIFHVINNLFAYNLPFLKVPFYESFLKKKKKTFSFVFWKENIVMGEPVDESF